MKVTGTKDNETNTKLKNTVKSKSEKFLQLLLPPGIKFDDIYIDAPQLAQELKISKRVVRNIRVAGKISYTNPFGKIFYYRQEIAYIMEAHKKLKKK